MPVTRSCTADRRAARIQPRTVQGRDGQAGGDGPVPVTESGRYQGLPDQPGRVGAARQQTRVEHTRVVPQPVHSARSGHAVSNTPPRSRTVRSRACPHGRSG